MDIGIEILSVSDKNKKKTMYLVFKNTQQRDIVYKALHDKIGKDCVTQDKNVDHYT